MLRTALLSLIPLLGLASCLDSTTAFNWSTPGSSSSAGALAVSGGGYRVDTEKPSIFYGTAVEQGRRRYTYLVLARDLELPDQEHELRVSGSTQADTNALLSDNSLSVQGIELTARFEARPDPERGVLESCVLTLQGQLVEPDGGWFFLFDGKDPDAGLQPLALEMPDLPDELEELSGFTEEWIDQAIRTHPEIAEFLGR